MFFSLLRVPGFCCLFEQALAARDLFSRRLQCRCEPMLVVMRRRPSRSLEQLPGSVDDFLGIRYTGWGGGRPTDQQKEKHNEADDKR